VRADLSGLFVDGAAGGAHSRATSDVFSTDAWEKLTASRKREKLPKLRTIPSAFDSLASLVYAEHSMRVERPNGLP